MPTSKTDLLWFPRKLADVYCVLGVSCTDPGWSLDPCGVELTYQNFDSRSILCSVHTWWWSLEKFSQHWCEFHFLETMNGPWWIVYLFEGWEWTMPSLQGFWVENFVSHQIQPFCAFLQKKAEKRKPEGAICTRTFSHIGLSWGIKIKFKQRDTSCVFAFPF